MKTPIQHKSRESKYKTPEKNVHRQVCDYLRKVYPKILWRSDSGAGMKMSIGMAKAQARIQNGMAWPDIMIAEGRWINIDETRGQLWLGLFIELKKDGCKIFKKDGVTPVNDHIKKQIECMEKLRAKGYKAEFGIGFDHARKIIDEYLKG